MRQKSVLIISWLLGGFLLAGLGACSGDDDSSVTKDHQQTDVVKLRRLTITETEDDVASQAGATRAILKEKDGLSASWMAGDGLTYCNLSRLKDMSGGIYSGALTASSTARISQFTGNVTCTGRLLLKLGDGDKAENKVTERTGAFAKYTGKITLPAADLDKLANADWTQIDMKPINDVDSNNSIDDRFQKAADMIPDEYKFTGSVDVTFNLHADGIYEMTELEKH